MSTIQSLRQFVSQRLTVAVEEIIAMFEKTIAEYEEEISRHRRMLGSEPLSGIKTTKNIHTGVFQSSQTLIVRTEVPSGPQESSPGLDQEPRIKEEPEEVLTSQDGQHRPGKADTPEFLNPPVCVKREHDEDNSTSSHIHHCQPENIHKAEAAVCSLTEAGEDECGPVEPGFDLDIGGFLKATTNGQLFLSHCFTTETHILDGDWNQRTESQTFTDTLRGNETVSRIEKNVHKCPVCSKTFQYNTALQRHIRCHTGERPFDCTVCDKKFKQKGGLQAHMRKHTGEKPFSCTVCGKNFAQNGTLASHMRIHTGEKPFSCPMCKKKYSERGTLVRHMRVHTGEKPFTCTLCGKRFSEKGNLNKHKRIHTGEKPFSCNVCEKRFSLMSHLKNHKCPGMKRTEAVPTHMVKGPQLIVQLNRHTF